MPAEVGRAPEVPVVLDLPLLLAERLAGAPDGLGIVRDALTTEVAETLARFGVPGTPAVEVREVSGPEGPNLAVRPFHLRVNGHRCRVPAEDVQRVLGYLQGRPAEPRAQLLGLLDIATGPDGGLDRDLSGDLWCDFVRLACRQAITRRPAVLLGPQQAAAFGRTIAQRRHNGADGAWLHAVLARVLAQRISLASQERIAQVLGEVPDGDRDEAAERIIATLRAPAVELRAPRAFLAELSKAWAHDPDTGLMRVREALRDESGMTYPDVRLVADPSLHPRALRVKINDAEGVPWIGLQAEHCLINAEPARMATERIAAEPTINPGTGIGASLVPISERERLEDRGWTTWAAPEHAMLCLTSALRAHAGRFVHLDAVDDALALLDTVKPELVAAVRSRLKPARLTMILRQLVIEGTPITDLSLVLNLLLEHGDDADAADRVRARLQRPLLRRWAVGTERDLVAAILVGSHLEDELRSFAGCEPDEQVVDRMLDSLQEEMDFLPAGAGMPLLLCSAGSRRAVRDQVSREFPRVAVLSSLELPPAAHVELLAELNPR